MTMDTFGLATTAIGIVLYFITINRPSRGWFAFSTFVVGIGVGALIASAMVLIQLGLLEM